MAYSGLGSGTEIDPYQITTIEQLVECFDIYSSIEQNDTYIYVYCKLMNDLNFNDSQQYWDCPEGLFYANNRSSYAATNNHIIFIDGNGFGIYNMYCYNKNGVFWYYTSAASQSGNQIVIQNCIFEAIIIKSKTNVRLVTNSGAGNYDTIYNSGLRFKNCDIRIKYYRYYSDDRQEYLLHKATAFTNCIINIDIILNNEGYSSDYNGLISGPNTLNSDYDNFYNEWNIKILMVNSISSQKSFSLFYNSVHQYSSFFIELIEIMDDTASHNYDWIIKTGTPIVFNCYFVIKNTIPASGYKANQVINVVKNGVNFYDAEVADSTINDSSTGNGTLLALTTAQCKNAQYLEEKGFIIAR